MRRRTEPDVLDRIRELAADGYSGPAIERLLSVDEGYADRTPSLRTIQSVARETPVTSEWWSVADASAEEARLVLPVLADRIAYLKEAHEAQRSRHGLHAAPLGTVRLARDLATWIAKIRAIEPDLPLRDAYRLAWRYWSNPTPELDAYLALKGWLGGTEG
jgi:hypothetical protein